MNEQATDGTAVITPRKYFDFERQRLAAAWEETREPTLYLKAHARVLDRAVVMLILRAALPKDRLAVAAVGGYGRSELYPYSDIDVLVLIREESGADEALRARIGEFVTSLWELGLTVGASVRTESEFLSEAAKDVSVATTYLESRLIWGSADLYGRSREAFAADLDAGRFFRDKMLELARRHQKFADTPYSLEPNIKESPGGLRDLQVFLWCAQAAGLADSVPAMKTAGLITEREMHTLIKCSEHLAAIRITLHLLTRRHEDRLLFDVQEDLAKKFGYSSTPQLRPSEAFMKRYYLNAKAVVQMSVIQLQAIADRLFGSNEKATPVQLEKAFVARGDEMDITANDVFKRDPNAILRTFYVFHSHPELTRLSTRLLRALWHAAPGIDEAFRLNPENQATFLSILKMPKGSYHSLKLMNMWGVLGRVLPAFRHIVGQMQHDLYHIFTVDQHTLRVVRNIRRFARSEFAHEYPFCSQIMAECPEPWRIAVAGLYHDIGKGLGGRHSLIGAQKVREFCESFRLGEETADFLSFLVREHLTMSRTAQKMDISDPDVVKRFVDIVGTKERLDALYLLTVSDIRATSPKVWTPWKAQLLETLYRSARDMLAGTSSDCSHEHAMAERKQKALELLGCRVSDAAREKLWRELNVVYFMRHTPEEIAWHTEVLAERSDTPVPVVELKRSEKLGGILILLYLPDRRDLFLRAVAALGRNGLSVVDARIHTTRHGWALDTFLVTDRFERMDPASLDAKIRRDMTAILTSDGPLPPAPKGKLSRRSRHFPTRPIVSTLPDESGRAWILSIVCTDRLGLLYSISEVLARYGVNLQTAKIATLGERAEDVFLIDGPALASDEQLLALEADLVEAVSPPKS
ncbi:MAG: [protein-PII] uridylyltransferase [Sutterella sp.]|nr:[protein-PII] uridylyltransferase [Sutterella sp.]